MVLGWFNSYKYNKISLAYNKINYIIFFGLSIDKLKKTFDNDEASIINYLDTWICYALIIRDMRRKKLNKSGRINFISDYLIL